MKDQDQVWGIETNEKSLAFGEIVCPVIILWKSIQGSTVAENVSGALAHGDDVEVIRTKQHDGFNFAFIKGRSYDSLGVPGPLQKGWVRTSLLRRYGQAEVSNAIH